MSVDTNFETCLFLSSHKLAIGVYEKQSLKKLFYNEILNNHNFTQPNHELLNHFLEKNIFDIEKGLKNFAKGLKEMNEQIDRELDEKERQKNYEKINNPQKKGGLFTFVAGAAAAGAAKNKLSPPIVVPENPDYVVVGMKPAGLNSWYVQYSKRSSLNSKSQFRVQRSRGGSTVGAGGTKFRVSWSG